MTKPKRFDIEFPFYYNGRRGEVEMDDDLSPLDHFGLPTRDI